MRGEWGTRLLLPDLGHRVGVTALHPEPSVIITSMASSSATVLITADRWAIQIEFTFPGQPIVWAKRRLALPTRRWKVLAESLESGLAVELAVKVDAAEGPLCASVRIRHGGRDVRSSDLRAIPIARLVRASALSMVMDIKQSGPTGLALEPRRRAVSADTVPELGRPRKPPGRPRGTMVPRAAELYRREMAKGNRNYRKVLAAELMCSEEYVGQLIYRARRRGLLEPVEKKTKSSARVDGSIARPSRGRRQSGGVAKSRKAR